MTTPSAAHREVDETAAEEFEVLLISDDLDPGYGVIVPALPGCVSQGDDREEALAMAMDAIQCYLAPPYPRPIAPAGEKERLIAEYTADGCRVELATVRVIV